MKHFLNRLLALKVLNREEAFAAMEALLEQVEALEAVGA